MDKRLLPLCVQEYTKLMSLTKDLSMNSDHGDIGGMKKPIHWGKSITDT